LLVLGALLSAACGSRSEATIASGKGAASNTSVERCNGLDDDGKRGVDDPFRDEAGRYATDEHCGACNNPCMARPESERVAHCQVVDGLPSCVAESCVAGYAATRDGHCAKIDERLCLACASDDDCGSLEAARCTSIAGESRCSVSCSLGCPSGTRCDAARDVCVPAGGSCSCKVGDNFEYACALDDSMRLPGSPTCVGHASCKNGIASACAVPTEICDEQDNNCDGKIDEGFRDPTGTYSLDPANCGQCGSSCLEDTGVDQQLVCGGDPFAPRCALACPDSFNGIAPGDRLDGDLDLATGCECVVQKVSDLPGPLLAKAELLDENCDGADGNVRESFYVASDGSDSNVGSPTRPLRTIGAAVARASASLLTMAARPHVFVASGAYTETITLADGVSVHGGYRRDFRALDPSAFTVEVRAVGGVNAPDGAVLVGTDVGSKSATTVQWLTLRGRDAAGGGPAVGVYLERPGPLLALTDLTIQAGVPGEGGDGADGSAGTGPSSLAGIGEVPRAARENVNHLCLASDANLVRGGAGGRAQCAGSDVRGGDGGQASCPSYASFQGSGNAGRAASGGSGGVGGQGGQDSLGPIMGACPGGVCCGLADFSVPSNFQGPRPGDNGSDGNPGSGGEGCTGGEGRFVGPLWMSGATGSSGGDGQPGSGGGGGGSGGGVEMNFDESFCAFADGVGGGGGGGGAGGCGGRGGRGGSNGPPSIALLVIDPGTFLMSNVIFKTATGGRGGNGGAGGDGGAGGSGAAGGTLALTARTTPTLAGPFPGARGGSGGSGGSGGGAGGGCGGASVGIWIVGKAPQSAEWQARNTFQLASGGAGGAGGAGARPGSLGANGRVTNVIAQM
jgi:hypothetical protein